MFKEINRYLSQFLFGKKQDIPLVVYTSHENKVMENRVWYVGENDLLSQFYTKLDKTGDLGGTNRFWAVNNINGTIRKSHTGLPRLIVDTLSAIVVSDMLEPTSDDEVVVERWTALAKEIDFNTIIQSGVSKTLTYGDGAFRINWDTNLSDYPTLDFYDASKVDYVYLQNKLKSITFKDEIVVGDKKYTLKSIYSHGYIDFKLFKEGKDTLIECPLSELVETSDLEPINLEQYGLGETILAVPLKFRDSPLFQHRGDSIFAGKYDAFDGLDEITSTWLDAVRSGRVQKFIPSCLIPTFRDASGKTQRLTPDPFNQWTEIGDDMSEQGNNGVDVYQPKIDYNSFVISYTSFLDIALQGVISPSTLGIDVKKMDNAEAQREKEKATLYTRDQVISVLVKAIPKIMQCLLSAEDIMRGQHVLEYELSQGFGQYANPSFETVLNAVGDARQRGIMSVEMAVEELWGDTKTAEEKALEVERIKNEQGITDVQVSAESKATPQNSLSSTLPTNEINPLENNTDDEDGNISSNIK